MFSLLLCLAGNITPIITSSSNDKIKAIQEKISDKVRCLNYKTDDQAAKIKEITNGRGVDFVVNNTGVGSLIDEIGYLCPRGGTISLVGFLAGWEADWKPSDLIALMGKGAKLGYLCWIEEGFRRHECVYRGKECEVRCHAGQDFRV